MEQQQRQVKIRKSSKTKFTATPHEARYTGTHPYLIGTTGVYYFNKEQDSYVYRPDGETKGDWYRVLKGNLDEGGRE